jgi:hypothetical protein
MGVRVRADPTVDYIVAGTPHWCSALGYVQGANDSRVPLSETLQVADKVRSFAWTQQTSRGAHTAAPAWVQLPK